MGHNQPHKPNKFTPQELLKYPGNENLSEQELEAQAETLLELSVILYNLYTSEFSTNAFEIGVFSESILPVESDSIKENLNVVVL